MILAIQLLLIYLEYIMYIIYSLPFLYVYISTYRYQKPKSLKSFHGASRRFDVYSDITLNDYKPIIDDYGHHPTEIESTIKTIRKIYNKKQIIMVFQPHRFSRTKGIGNHLLILSKKLIK